MGLLEESGLFSHVLIGPWRFKVRRLQECFRPRLPLQSRKLRKTDDACFLLSPPGLQYCASTMLWRLFWSIICFSLYSEPSVYLGILVLGFFPLNFLA